VSENETRAEAERALACLYLWVPESVGDDVKSKVMAALDSEASREREAICAFLSSWAIFNVSALVERIRRGDHHPRVMPDPCDDWWCVACKIGYGSQDIESTSDTGRCLCSKCGAPVVDAGQAKEDDDGGDNL
jgi:hypothetical protein